MYFTFSPPPPPPLQILYPSKVFQDGIPELKGPLKEKEEIQGHFPRLQWWISVSAQHCAVFISSSGFLALHSNNKSFLIGKSTDQASNNLLTRFTDETELGYSGLVLHVVTIPIGN